MLLPCLCASCPAAVVRTQPEHADVSVLSLSMSAASVNKLMESQLENIIHEQLIRGRAAAGLGRCQRCCGDVVIVHASGCAAVVIAA